MDVKVGLSPLGKVRALSCLKTGRWPQYLYQKKKEDVEVKCIMRSLNICNLHNYYHNQINILVEGAKERDNLKYLHIFARIIFR
jgi:hypothetical protein